MGFRSGSALLFGLAAVLSIGAAATANECAGCNAMDYWPRERCCLTTQGCKLVLRKTDGDDYRICVASPSGQAGAAAASPAAPPAITAATTRNYTEVAGGDCCPGNTSCEGGTGPYAISTGGDYPEWAEPRCDHTPGCVAFGQMYKYVTRFHFDSRLTCQASQASNESLGDYHCDEAPALLRSGYNSTKAMHAKLPFSCFTTTARR